MFPIPYGFASRLRTRKGAGGAAATGAANECRQKPSISLFLPFTKYERRSGAGYFQRTASTEGHSSPISPRWRAIFCRRPQKHGFHFQKEKNSGDRQASAASCSSATSQRGMRSGKRGGITGFGDYRPVGSMPRNGWHLWAKALDRSLRGYLSPDKRTIILRQRRRCAQAEAAGREGIYEGDRGRGSDLQCGRPTNSTFRDRPGLTVELGAPGKYCGPARRALHQKPFQGRSGLRPGLPAFRRIAMPSPSWVNGDFSRSPRRGHVTNSKGKALEAGAGTWQEGIFMPRRGVRNSTGGPVHPEAGHS